MHTNRIFKFTTYCAALLAILSCTSLAVPAKHSILYTPTTHNTITGIQIEATSSYNIQAATFIGDLRSGITHFGATALPFYEHLGLIHVEKDSIFMNTSNAKKELLFSYKNVFSNKIDNITNVSIYLTTLSPNEKQLIFFLDRRLPSTNSSSESEMLYMKGDSISGYYLLDLETKKLKKLKTRDAVIGWIDEKTLLMSSNFYPNYSSANNVHLFDVEKNAIKKKVNFPKEAVLEQDRNSKRLFRKSLANNTTTELIELNPKTFRTIGKTIRSNSLFNSIKISPKTSQILSIDSYRMRGESIDMGPIRIFINGNLITKIQGPIIEDYAWLTEDEIAFTGKNQLFIYSLSQKKLTYKSTLEKLLASSND